MSNKLLCALRQVLQDFANDLKDNIFDKAEEYSDIELLKLKIKNGDMELISKKLIKILLPNESKINKKDTTIFENFFQVFGNFLTQEKTEYYSNLLKDGRRMTTDDKDTVFSYLVVIANICKQLKKNP
ncbi:MAG TPA: hypothetical protein VLE02_02070 [Nitrosarchaeum sp.]|nr:hypothetical protein [Nitrosarchaeum sp.]